MWEFGIMLSLFLDGFLFPEFLLHLGGLDILVMGKPFKTMPPSFSM